MCLHTATARQHFKHSSPVDCTSLPPNLKFEICVYTNAWYRSNPFSYSNQLTNRTRQIFQIGPFTFIYAFILSKFADPIIFFSSLERNTRRNANYMCVCTQYDHDCLCVCVRVREVQTGFGIIKIYINRRRRLHNGWQCNILHIFVCVVFLFHFFFGAFH